MHGPRKLYIVYIRVGNNCSTLNYDLYRSGLVNDPSCSCGFPCENAYPFIFECPIYRRALFNRVNSL